MQDLQRKTQRSSYDYLRGVSSVEEKEVVYTKMYASYRLIDAYRSRNGSKQLQETYVNDNDSSTNTTLDTVWLIALALVLLLDLILVGFGTYYALKCQALGKIPLWLTVVLILFLWIPSPIQPFLAVTLTIWGGAAGCQ